MILCLTCYEMHSSSFHAELKNKTKQNPEYETEWLLVLVICILCVHVKINKHLFEPFCVCIMLNWILMKSVNVSVNVPTALAIGLYD